MGPIMLAFIDRFFKLCYTLVDFVKVNSVKEHHVGKPKEESSPFSAFSFTQMTLSLNIHYHRHQGRNHREEQGNRKMV